MNKITQNTIYQSGEQVPHNATYQVVGANFSAVVNKKESAVRTFKVGEFFPNYEGRAVCWHVTEFNNNKPEIAAQKF